MTDPQAHKAPKGRTFRVAEAARAVLSRPGLPYWGAALALLLLLPALRLGLQADDYFVRMVALGCPGLPDMEISPLDCFSFADGVPEHNRLKLEQDLLPWWVHETASVSFFRPLSALTHCFDFRFLEPAWWLMHLHSLLWYALLCVAAGFLYRRMIPLAWVAGLAALFFALDDAHGIPAAWLSNRNAVMTTLSGVLVLIAHDAWRRGHWRPGAPLAWLALVFGLASGEAAISVGAYLFAYALFMDPAPWRRRAMALAPYALIAGTYFVCYRIQGYGTAGSGLYRDPFHEPAGFLLAVAKHLPALLHGQLGLAPANVHPILGPTGQIVYSGVGVLAVAAAFALFMPLLRRDALARFWALGMVLSTVPVCSIIPAERLLGFAGIGAMGLVAQFIAGIGEECGAGGVWRRRIERGAVCFFLLAHGVVAPLSMPFAAANVAIFGRMIERGMEQLPQGPAASSRSIVMLNAPFDVFATSVVPFRLAHGEPPYADVWILNGGLAALEAKRIDRFTLELRPEDGFCRAPFASTFRSTAVPFAVGDVFRVDGFTAEVLALTEDRRPAAVRFRFDKPLEDPSLAWYCGGVDNMEPWQPPSAGESAQLPKRRALDWLFPAR